jgi:hypothetical protein
MGEANTTCKNDGANMQTKANLQTKSNGQIPANTQNTATQNPKWQVQANANKQIHANIEKTNSVNPNVKQISQAATNPNFTINKFPPLVEHKRTRKALGADKIFEGFRNDFLSLENISSNPLMLAKRHVAKLADGKKKHWFHAAGMGKAGFCAFYCAAAAGSAKAKMQKILPFNLVKSCKMPIRKISLIAQVQKAKKGGKIQNLQIPSAQK